MQNSDSNVECSYYGELKYGPKEVIKAYIGLNGENVTDLEKWFNIDQFVHHIDKVIKHEDWDGSLYTFPDFALLKLAKRVEITNHRFAERPIVPACLPSKDVKLHGEHAYVAGWGKTRNDACFTDNDGPNRHQQCRFPFIYENKFKDSCQLTITPSTKNKRCQQFKLDKGPKAMPKKRPIIDDFV